MSVVTVDDANIPVYVDEAGQLFSLEDIVGCVIDNLSEIAKETFNLLTDTKS